MPAERFDSPHDDTGSSYLAGKRPHSGSKKRPIRRYEPGGVRIDILGFDGCDATYIPPAAALFCSPRLRLRVRELLG